MKMKKEVEIMNATAPLVQITVHCHPSVEFIKNTTQAIRWILHLEIHPHRENRVSEEHIKNT